MCQGDTFGHSPGAKYCEELFDHYVDIDGVTRHVVDPKVVQKTTINSSPDRVPDHVASGSAVTIVQVV